MNALLSFCPHSVFLSLYFHSSPHSPQTQGLPINANQASGGLMWLMWWGWRGRRGAEGPPGPRSQLASAPHLSGRQDGGHTAPSGGAVKAANPPACFINATYCRPLHSFRGCTKMCAHTVASGPFVPQKSRLALHSQTDI